MILHGYTNLSEFRDDLRALPRLSRAEDVVNSSDIQYIVEKLLKSKIQLDAILLLVNHLSYLHSEWIIWKFYQQIIERSHSKVETPYVVAMAAAHQFEGHSSIIKYNITRLIYISISSLFINDIDGHSSIRIGCARVLIEIGEYRNAGWILRELRDLLSSDEELEKELSFVANDKEILKEMMEKGPTISLRNLARHILQTSGLWDADH